MATALRSRWAKAAVAVVVLAAVAGGLWLLVRESSISRIRKVEVVGLGGARAERLRAAALEQSTLDVDEAALRRAAAGKPEVRSLKVETDFPDRARITVTLYTPIAAVGPAGAEGVAVTADGTVLSGVSPLGLPRIEGTTLNGRVQERVAMAALRVVAAAPSAFRGRIESATWQQRRGVVVRLSRGPLVYFGDPDLLEAKWDSLSRVLADRGSVGATYVDVRIPRRPVIGGVPGGVEGGVDPADPSQSLSDGAATPDGADDQAQDGGGAAPDGG